MSSKASDIVEGFTNLLKSKLLISESDIDELAEKRMSVCNSCEFKKVVTNRCRACGCYLPAKTRVLKQKCPKNKWSQVQD